MKVMGILNVTPDSFWEENRRTDVVCAVDLGRQMFRDGAWIVDVGGESTRPGAAAVPLDQELDRVIPVIDRLSRDGRVSVDTRRAEVARAAVEAGAHMINDVSGHLVGVAGEVGAAYLGMDSRELPVAADTCSRGGQVVGDVVENMRRIATDAERCEIQEWWVDPGIGFSKTADDDLRVLRKTRQICGIFPRVALGVSRKRVVGAVTGRPVEHRLAGSLAMVAHAWWAGVDLMRVHDVRQSVDVVDTLRTLSE